MSRPVIARTIAVAVIAAGLVALPPARRAFAAPIWVDDETDVGDPSPDDPSGGGSALPSCSTLEENHNFEELLGTGVVIGTVESELGTFATDGSIYLAGDVLWQFDVRECEEAAGGEGTRGIFEFIVDISDFSDHLVAEVKDETPDPALRFDPPLVPWAFVRHPMSTWVSACADTADPWCSWRVVSRTDDTYAWAGLVVSVTASPQTLSFDPGDGTEGASCGSAEATAPGSCTHTYLAASKPSNLETQEEQEMLAYDASGTIVWEVEVIRTISGNYTESHVTSTQVWLPVAEVQTVIESSDVEIS